MTYCVNIFDRSVSLRQPLMNRKLIQIIMIMITIIIVIILIKLTPFGSFMYNYSGVRKSIPR